MIEENIRFQELYKRLDNLCKDCYNSQEGVSEYIRQMDKYMYEGDRIIEGWETIYNDLKHVRWIRNQLAHEVGTLNSNIVENCDILFVSKFYDKIINTIDPLSLLRKYKQRKYQDSRQSINNSHPTHIQSPLVKNRSGFLSKLLSKIKKFFK